MLLLLCRKYDFCLAIVFTLHLECVPVHYICAYMLFRNWTYENHINIVSTSSSFLIFKHTGPSVALIIRDDFLYL